MRSGLLGDAQVGDEPLAGLREWRVDLIAHHHDPVAGGE